MKLLLNQNINYFGYILCVRIVLSTQQKTCPNWFVFLVIYVLVVHHLHCVSISDYSLTVFMIPLLLRKRLRSGLEQERLLEQCP